MQRCKAQGNLKENSTKRHMESSKKIFKKTLKINEQKWILINAEFKILKHVI